LAANAASYSGSYQVFQWDSGELDNAGETITLRDAFGQLVDEVAYGATDPWPSAPDGGGQSLALVSPAADNSDAANWAASAEMGGTPGAVNWP
jgi:hypothetical protein